MRIVPAFRVVGVEKEACKEPSRQTSGTEWLSLETTARLLLKSQWVYRHDDKGSGKVKVTWAHLNQVRAQCQPEEGSEKSRNRKKDNVSKMGQGWKKKWAGRQHSRVNKPADGFGERAEKNDGKSPSKWTKINTGPSWGVIWRF